MPIDPPADSDLTPRQRQILQTVQDQGFATIEALARHFSVSTQTIRRDIIRLDEIALLQRFHGGAGLREAPVRLSYEEKRAASTGAKARIARALADTVKAGSSVFLDVGTTAEAVAHALADKERLNVFTSSLPAALAFAGRAGIEVFVTGGTLRSADGALVGDAATAALGRFKVDLAVIGCSGFDEDGAAMDFDLHKVAVKQAALAAARRSVIVADSAKFERSALVRIAAPGVFRELFCEAPPPPRLREALSAAAVAVTVA